MAYMFLTVLSQLLLLLLSSTTVTSLPQRQDVSQDVAVEPVDQYDGRGNDQWWKNYEVIEDHVDDLRLDDQLEMLYMYSRNPLDFAGVAGAASASAAAVTSSSTTPKPLKPIRHTLTTAASDNYVRQSYVSSSYSNNRSSQSVFLSSTTPLPYFPQKHTRATTYSPSSKPWALQTSSPSSAVTRFNDQASSSSSSSYDNEPEISSQRNRVRVLIKRPTVNVDDKLFKPLYKDELTKKVHPEKQSTVAAFSVNYPPVASESGFTRPTYLPYSRESTSRVTKPFTNPASVSSRFVDGVTGETFRTTESTAHHFVEPTPTPGNQYTKLLNRYSLLDKVNRDLNSASSEHRGDLTSLQSTSDEHSPRQTRNDVLHPPSSRSFQSAPLQDDHQLPSTVTLTATKRTSRRRRPIISTTDSSLIATEDLNVPTTELFRDNTNYDDEEISSTVEPQLAEENLFRRRPSARKFRTSTLQSTTTQDYSVEDITSSDFLTSELPETDVSEVTSRKTSDWRPFVPRPRPQVSSTATTSKIVTTVSDAVSTSLPPLISSFRHDRFRPGPLTTPLSTLQHSEVTPENTDDNRQESITESLRFKQTSKSTSNDNSTALDGGAAGINEVNVRPLSAVSKPWRLNQRQRTTNIVPRQKVSQSSIDLDVQANISKTSTKPPRGTSAFRRPLITSAVSSSSTTTTTTPYVTNADDSSTTLSHTTYHPRPFGSSRLRFKSSAITAVPTLTVTESTLANNWKVTTAEAVEVLNVTEPLIGRRKFKARTNATRISPKFTKFSPAITTATWPSTTTPKSNFNATTASIVPDTPSEPASAKTLFTKKFRPRPTFSRSHATAESTQSSVLPETEEWTTQFADTTEPSVMTSSRSSTRILPRNRFSPSTRFELATTSSPHGLLSSTYFPGTVSTGTLPGHRFNVKVTAIGTEDSTVNATPTTLAASGTSGKRRRKPIRSKKVSAAVSATPASWLQQTTLTVSSVPARTSARFSTATVQEFATSTASSRLHGDRLITTAVPLEVSSVAAAGSTRRQKLRRRKLTQRSTLSGADEYKLQNATTAALTEVISLTTTTELARLPTTTTSSSSFSSSDSTEPTKQDITKKPLLNEKVKKNSTVEVKSGGKDNLRRFSIIEPNDMSMLQTAESGDNVWLSGSAKHVEAVDGSKIGGLLGVNSGGKLWLTSSDNDDFHSSSSSDDTVPPLLAMVSSDGDVLDENDEALAAEEEVDAGHDEEVNEDSKDTAEQASIDNDGKPKLIQKSRSATFSVSSSTSVRDPTNSNAKSDDDKDQDLIIIDKTDLRNTDDVTSTDKESIHSDYDEKDEHDSKSSSTKVDADSVIRSTTSPSTTTVVDDDADDGDKSKADLDEEDEHKTTTTTTTTQRSGKQNRENGRSTPRSSNGRSSTTTSTQKTQQSSSVSSTSESSSSTTVDPESGKSSSNSAVSYFGEDEETAGDHGVLDDLDIGGGEDGAVESSYNPDAYADELAGGGEVAADGFYEQHGVDQAMAASESEQWNISPLTDFSGPIRVSSSVNVEVLSKAPKQVQQVSGSLRRTKNTADLASSAKTRSRILRTNSSLHDDNISVENDTMTNVMESSTETLSDENDELVSVTTKRDISIKNVAHPLPFIKTADDIVELFNVVTNSPSELDKVQSFQPPSKAEILKINSTSGNENVTKFESDEDRDNVDDLVKSVSFNPHKGPTNCSKADRNLCSKSEDYPRELVEFVVRRHKVELDRLWQEIQADRTSSRLLSEEFDRKKEELSVCDSSVEVFQPGWSKDAITGKWMIIINTREFPQEIRIEACLRPQMQCLFISPYYKSTCVEHYSVHRLVAIRADDPSDGPVIGIFKYPCGCSCKVEMFSSRKH